MRNHNEKTRDMARSALASKRRGSARLYRRRIHRRERSRVREELRALRAAGYGDDFAGDLTWTARREMLWMVSERREADKVAPLLTWAERLVAQDARLTAASFEERVVHFRSILPSGVVGDHALFHLSWVLDGEQYRRRHSPDRAAQQRAADIERLRVLVAGGYHGDLNRRIRAEVPRYSVTSVRVPAERRIDEDHPEPGLIVPAHWVKHRIRRTVRYLQGAHDIEAFVAQALGAELEIMRTLHTEIVSG